MQKRNIKNLRIIKILMAKPDGQLSKYRVAKLADCSVPWVIEFLRKLERQKLVRKTKVLKFDYIVDYYIKTIPKLRFFECYVQNPIKFLKEAKLDYALTTYGAENLVSHHLIPTRYDIYVNEKDFDEWKKIITKKGLLGKGNLKIIVAYDSYIFSETKKIKGINTVSKSQLMIDLKKEGGAAVEAYELLLKNVQRH